MEFKDYFKNPRKGILKDEFEFGGKRRREFLEALRAQPRSGKVYGPGELLKELAEKKVRLERLRKAKAERPQREANNK